MSPTMFMDIIYFSFHIYYFCLMYFEVHLFQVHSHLVSWYLGELTCYFLVFLFISDSICSFETLYEINMNTQAFFWIMFAWYIFIPLLKKIFFYFFIWLCWVLVVAYRTFVVACGIQFPDQGLNSEPLPWEGGILATGPQGSPCPFTFNIFIFLSRFLITSIYTV